MYEKLINIVYDYIYKIGSDNFESFNLSLHSSEILLNEKDIKYNCKYKKKYDLKKIESLVEDFLMKLNPTYLEYYRLRKEDGTIIFDFDDKSGFCYSTYNDDTNSREIYISLTGYIEDAFSIVHELFHDMNMTDDFDSYGRYFFTECLSILGEFLLSDYLLGTNNNEEKNVIKTNLFLLKKKALEVNFNLKMIEKYFEKGYLDNVIMNDIIQSYPKKYKEDIQEIIMIICEQEWLTLEEEQSYILSCLCATYMYDRIKNNKKNLNELFDLNKVLNDYDLSQVLDYLELEHDDFDLTKETYSILQKKYNKFLKRW